MLKKFDIKSFMVGGICATLLTTTVSGFATGAISKNLSVVYNNFKLVVDGKPVSFGKDLAGNKIEPFAHQGTTYLPIRALGEALDKKVDWDSKTNTVYVGKTPGEGEFEYLTEVLKGVGATRTHKLGDEGKFNMNGKLYNTGFHNTSGGQFIYFNLDNKYKEVEGDIGTMYSRFEGENGLVHANQNPKDLNIYLDDKLYKTIKISGETAPQKIKIPVSGVNQLKFKVDSRWVYFGLADLTIK